MTKIEISELSIGDWVMNLYANKPSRVIGLRPMFQDTYEIIAVSDDTQYMLIEDKELHNYEPIRLTPAILEKNGFVKNGEYNEWNIGTWDTPDLIGVSLERPSIIVKHLGTSIFLDQAKYVHQLQRALRLAGVKKEIEV